MRVFIFIEYPYLIEPPTQISNTYERIEIKLNFFQANIGGDKNMKLKYYQLFIKVSFQT